MSFQRAIFVFAALFAFTAPGTAETPTHRIRYDVSLLGLPVARAVFESRVNEAGFAIAGSFSSAGIARIFDKTNGSLTVTGRFNDRESRPNDYSLDYLSGKKKQITQIRFDNNAQVTSTVNEPPLKERGSDWIPLEEAHLRQVADPVSALLLPAKDAAEICNRTVRVYDGETRVDLVFSPVSSSEHFRQAEVTCQAKFVPVAGYRPNHSTIVHLRDKARIRIGFAAVNNSGLYSPVEANIGTKIGTVHIRARPA